MKQSESAEHPLMRIDVGAVLAARLGRRPPRAVTAALERLVCQSRLNAMLEYAWPRRGADFCRAVVEHLGITVRVDGLDRLPASPRIIAVSNHPLGGLDGMILIDIFSRAYGRDVRFVVNDLLGAVEPLSDVFVPVNKHGAQSRDYAAAVEAAFASDAPVLMFPAGLCSRRRDGRVADLEWQKMFVLKARRYGRAVVPVHFDAANSPRFYRWARLRERLGIRFNAEMVLLPSEVFRAEGRTFDIRIGHPVDSALLEGDPRQAAARIRNLVYTL